MIAHLIASLAALFPDPADAIRGGALGLLLFVAAGTGAGKLRRMGWRDGDTRKIFHFAIFTTAALTRALLGIGAVSAYGAVVFLGVIVAVRRGEGDLVFEALARQSDRPARGLHVVLPLIATALGGITTHLVGGPWSAAALLVGGWGDAVGEPIGIRWGRRKYTVPSFGGVRSVRSIEGTTAVFAASWLAAIIGLTLIGVAPLAAIGAGLATALAATAIESYSPHGTDNFTVMAIAALVLRLTLN